MAKKTSDPKLIALLDKRAMVQAAHDRAFARLVRAVNKLSKCRAQLRRIGKAVRAAGWE